MFHPRRESNLQEDGKSALTKKIEQITPLDVRPDPYIAHVE
jgi:hypothetical protein